MSQGSSSIFGSAYNAIKLQFLSRTATDDHLHYQLSYTTSIPDDEDKYDLCLVFNAEVGKDDLKERSADILDKIIHILGLSSYTQFYSHNNDVRFVLFKLGQSNCKKLAQALQYNMLLDPKKAAKQATEGSKTLKIDPFRIVYDRSISTLQPYEYIFAPYNQDESIQKYFFKPDNAVKGVFTKANILDLLLVLLQSSTNDGGAGLSLRDLKESGAILDYFPIADAKLKETIKEEYLLWSNVPWNLPFGAISDYFGEKMAMVYELKGFVTCWLFVPALAGIAVEVSTLYYNDFSRPEIIAFGYLISLWLIILLAQWRKEEGCLYMRRGMYTKKVDEDDEDLPQRPEFVGTLQKSYINGQEVVFANSVVQSLRLTFSIVVTTLMIIFIAGATLGIYVLRSKIYTIGKYNVSYNHQWIISAINIVVIEIFTKIYNGVAVYLTRIENHRSDEAYESSLIIKLFVYQFISNFQSFYWIAFGAIYVKDSYNQCNSSSVCAKDCAVNLVILFGFKMFKGLLYDVMLPNGRFFLKSCTVDKIKSILQCKCCCDSVGGIDEYTMHDLSERCCENCIDAISEKNCFCPGCSDGLCRDTCLPSRSNGSCLERLCCNMQCCRKVEEDGNENEKLGCCTYFLRFLFGDGQASNISETEIEYSKRPLHRFDSVFVHVDELVLILYVTLFVALVPATPAVLLICNWLGLRGRIWSLLEECRKPLPYRGMQAKPWQTIYYIMAALVALTNAALVTFSLSFLSSWSTSYKLLFFLGFHWSLLSVLLCASCGTAESREVRVQRKREKFIVDKIIHKIPSHFLNPIDII